MTLEGTLGYETVSISLCVNIEPSRNCKYLIKGVKEARKKKSRKKWKKKEKRNNKRVVDDDNLRAVIALSIFIRSRILTTCRAGSKKFKGFASWSRFLCPPPPYVSVFFFFPLQRIYGDVCLVMFLLIIVRALISRRGLNYEVGVADADLIKG